MAKNSSRNIWLSEDFTGGLSISSKRGIKATIRNGIGLDYKTDPDLLSANRRLVKDSSTTVDGAVKWLVEYNGDMFAYDDNGVIYRKTGSTWSELRDVDAQAGVSSTGQGLAVFDNYLYYAHKTGFGRYGPLDGTPAFSDNFLEGTDDQKDQEQLQTAANTYTLQTSINEGATHRQTFTPDKQTLVSITILPISKGTGNFTVTLHDEANTSLGAVTIASANITNSTLLEFVFTTPIQLVVGSEYHFHVTVSTGTSTIRANTASDSETLRYFTEYQILEDDDNWHPMMYFPGSQSLVIGNGRFLAEWDGVVYRDISGGINGENQGSERLVFSKEESVRGLALVGDYLAVGTTHGANVYDHGSSTIYFWDGSSATYTNFKNLIGEFNAMAVDADGLLHIIHGGDGRISIFSGSLDLVHQIPNIGRNKYVEVYPGAITTWGSDILFGISDGDSTSVYRGVYSYGRKSKDYQRSLNIDYTISAGSFDDDVQITAVKGVGPTELYVAWQDDTTYGIDLIDTTQDLTEATMETLIFDASRPYMEKRASSIKLTFEALANGQTFEVRTKTDRASSWGSVIGTVTYANTENGTTVEKTLPYTERWKELEIQLKLKTTTSTAPKLISMAVYFDFVDDEQE